jgi:hypothetical protein
MAPQATKGQPPRIEQRPASQQVADATDTLYRT